MNAFSNMKDLYKMQKEAKVMQKKLQEKTLSGTSKEGNVTVYLNAAQEFQDIHIEDWLLDPEQFENLKKEMKDAFKDFQKKLQKEMMKDFDLDSLKSMLGK
ncbi:MAG: hypothetical protein Fur003_5530 [Candidatus Dojkabacteria bacterium]